jgi:His/Glu/Gln/Arg/opine family amino acid ABC transporter permease subunit
LENFQYFLSGLLITVIVSATAWAIGSPLGLLIAMLRVKRLLGIAPMLALYVSFVRSLPLPLLVMLFYFGLPVLGWNLDPLPAAIAALALNTSAFNSEIWRAAILDFPIGQLEAAKSVGMVGQQTFWRIILPQLWRASLPMLTNEITLLVKASPAIGIIGIDDLTRRAGKVAASNYEPLPTIITGMVLYAVVLLTLSLVSRSLEQRLQHKYELI